MYTRQDVFNKYYKSDIFNTSQNNLKSRQPRVIIRPNYPTLESTKEDLFNIEKERRIKRNKYQDESNNKTGLNLSITKRKRNYDRIYGSDIFNQRSSSEGRRKGLKLIPNTNQKSKCFDEMKNDDEYIKDLQYYTETHRSEKKEFKPDLSMKYVLPQERYFRHHYEIHGKIVLPETDYFELTNGEEKKDNYIKNKLYLNRDSNTYNPNRSVSESSKREIRYKRQKLFNMEEKRPFVEISEHPRNNSKINKQIQYESHIFQNEEKNKNFNKQVKEIDDRIEQERKRRAYNRNVIGLPYRKINRDFSNNDKNSDNLRWARNKIDWSSPEAEIMFSRTYSEKINRTYGPKGPSAYQRQLIQNADSYNLDTLSGQAKSPIINLRKPKREEIINSETSRKIEDFVQNIPDLNEGQKLGIRMKASVLDVKNDEEFNTKSKIINDFYKKKPKKQKGREITRKVNERNEKGNKLNDDILDKGYHNFTLTYATKGNQFDKLDDYEIKNMFAKKGVQIYDVKKNPFDKGGYNQLTFKVKGSDVDNQISNKVKLVKDDLIRKNYKINIEKEKPRNNRRNPKNLLGGARGKAVIMTEPSTTVHGSKYTTMPKEIMARKGFTRAWEGLDYEYKKFKP